MFSIKNFVMKTLQGMKERYPEFQVREFALGWYSKGVLTDDDLATIEDWYAPVVPVEEDPIIIEEGANFV